MSALLCHPFSVTLPLSALLCHPSSVTLCSHPAVVTPLPSLSAPALPAMHPEVLLLQPCGAPTVLRLPP